MKTRVERIETIKIRVEASSKSSSAPTHKLKFRNDSHYLPIIKLEPDYLAYRLTNSRTLRQQQGYLRSHPDLPSDIFEDPETKLAQSIQEELLLKMVDSQKEFINDLNKYGQDEPAIITYDGFIVNGNRRTAAMKRLGIDYISCAVLPKDVNAKEIYQIEQDLQIAEDFRQDYDWVNELLNIRAGKEDERYKMTERQLLKNLKITAQELRSRLFRLDLIDGFLEWKQIPGQYDYPKLDDAKQIFQELEKGLRSKCYTDITKQDLMKQHIYLLIENRPEEGRLYDHVREVIKNFDDIISTLNKDNTKKKEIEEPQDEPKVAGPDIAKDEPKLVYEPVSKDDTVNEKGEKGEDTNEEDKGNEGEKRIEISPNDKEGAKKLIEIKDDVKAKNREKRSKEAIYDSISIALRNISGLSVDDDSTKLVETSNKLKELIKIASELLVDVENKLKEN